MRRVFVPGDILKVKKVPFDRLQRGDVVVFYPHGKDKKGVVHRIIRRTENDLITMGDNNPAPDVLPVTRNMAPCLVVMRYPVGGGRHPVRNGWSGRLEFRLHRLQRFGSRAARAVARRFLPLMFWRICLTDGVLQGTDVYYSFRGKIVARKRSTGVVEFYPSWNKIRFKIQ